MYGSVHLQDDGLLFAPASAVLCRKTGATGIIFNLEIEINMDRSQIGPGEASMYKRLKSFENGRI